MDTRYNVVPDKKYKSRTWYFVGSLVCYCAILAISALIIWLSNRRGNPTVLKVFYWMSLIVNIIQIAMLSVKYTCVSKGIFNKWLVYSEFILAAIWELIVSLQFIAGCVAFKVFRLDFLALALAQAIVIFFMLVVSRKVSYIVDKTSKMPSVGNFEFRFSFSNDDKKAIKKAIAKKERRKVVWYGIVCAVICIIECLTLGLSKLPPKIDDIFAENRLLSYVYYKNVDGYDDGYYVSKVYYGVNDSIVIPSLYNNKPVVGILSNALSDIGDIKSIQIGEYDEDGNLNSNIKVIEENAINLNYIDSVIIPKSVERMEKNAIKGDKIKTVDYNSNHDFSMTSISSPSLVKLNLNNEEKAIKVDYQNYDIVVNIPLSLYNEYRSISYDDRGLFNAADKGDNIIIDFETDCNVHLESLILPKGESGFSLESLKNRNEDSNPFINDITIYNKDHLAKNGFTAKPGYVFRGWYRDNGFVMETSITDDQFVTFTTDTTLYARWCALKTVELDWGNYFPYKETTTYIDFVITDAEEESVTFPKLQKYGGDVVRAGFENLSWYYGDKRVERTADLLDVAENTIALTPKWEMSAPTIGDSITQVGENIFRESGLKFTFDEAQTIAYRLNFSHLCKEKDFTLRLEWKKKNNRGDYVTSESKILRNESSSTFYNTFRNCNQSGDYVLVVTAIAPTGESAVSEKYYTITINKKLLTFNPIGQEIPQKVVTYNGEYVDYIYPNEIPSDISAKTLYDVGHNLNFGTTRPCHAGEYDVKFVFSKSGEEADNYSTVSLTSSLLIKQKEVSAQWNVSSFEYSSKYYSIIPTVVGHISKDESVAFYTDLNRQKDVGTYTTSITGINNSDYKYADNIEISHSWTITPKSIQVTWGQNSYRYNGDTQDFLMSIDGFTKVDIDKAREYFSLYSSGLKTTTSVSQTDENILEVRISAKNAGSYLVKMQDFYNNNYNASTILADSCTFSIEPAIIGAQWSNTNVTYTGTNQAMTLTLSGFCDGDELQYTANNYLQKIDFTSDGIPFFESNNGGKLNINFTSIDAGSYSAKVNSILDGNYILSSTAISSVMKIEKARYKTSWITPKLVYNGQEQSLDYTIEAKSRDLDNIIDTVVAENNCSSISYEKTNSAVIVHFNGVSAATYDINITSIGNDKFRNNYENVEAKLSFTIEKLPLNVVWDHSSFDYNGEERSVAATIINRCGNDIIPLSYTGETGIDVNNYTANVSTSNLNYATSDSCKHSWSIIKKVITVSAYNASDTYYDGLYHEFGFRCEGFVNTTSRPDLETIADSAFVYSATSIGNKKISRVSGVTRDNNCVIIKYKAIDASTYTITLGLNSLQNYRITGHTKSFVILPKTVENTWVNGDTLGEYSNSDFVYDKTSHSVKPVFTGLCTREDTGVTDTISNPQLSNNTGTNAQIYNATIKNTNNSNYAVNPKTSSYKWIINQRELVPVWDNHSYIYNGSNQNKLVSYSNVLSGDSVSTLSYNVYNSAGTLTTSYSDAGTYIAEINSISSSNNNYKLPNSGLKKEYVINKRELSFVFANVAPTLTYNGSYQNCIKLTISGFYSYAGASAFKTTDINASYTEGSLFTISTRSGTSSIYYLSAKNAGDYSLRINGMNNNNYSFATASLDNPQYSITINKKILSWSWPSATMTYDGDLKTLGVTPTNKYGLDTIVFTYNCSGSAYVDGEISPSKTTDPRAKNAGVYTIEIDSISNDNYTLEGSTSEKTKELTILRREITVSKIGNSGATYNGDYLTGLSLQVSGYVQSDSSAFNSCPIVYENDKFTIEHDSYNSSNHTIENKAVNAGTYTVKVKDLNSSFNNSNYVLKSSSKTNFTYTIEKASVLLEWGDDKLTYNAEKQTISATITSPMYNNILTGTVDAVELSYSNNEYKDAGSYTATVEVVSNKNYQLISNTEKSWEIKKKMLSTSWDRISATVYNGDKQDAHLTISGVYAADLNLFEDIAIYSASKESTSGFTIGSVIITNNKPTLMFSEKNAGIYKYQISSLNLTNYTIADSLNSFVINKKQMKLTWDKTTAFEYDGTAHSIYCLVTELCGEDNVSLSYSGNSNINAGNYTAKVTGINGNVNYTLPSNTIQNWEIAKKELTAIWNGDKVFTYDGTPKINTVRIEGYVESDMASNITASSIDFDGNNTMFSKDGNAVVLQSSAIDAGEYVWRINGSTNVNYSLSQSDRKIIINKKSLSTSWIGDNVYTYSGTEVITKLKITGFENNDESSVNKNQLIVNGTIKDLDSSEPGVLYINFSAKDVDSYNYSLSAYVNVNYNVDFSIPIEKTITINKRELVLSYDGVTQYDYNRKNHVTTLTISGFVNGEESKVLKSWFETNYNIYQLLPNTTNHSIDLKFVNSRSGEYTYRCNGSVSLKNYYINQNAPITQTVTIKQAELNYTWISAEHTYNGENQGDDLIISGIVSGDLTEENKDSLFAVSGSTSYSSEIIGSDLVLHFRRKDAGYDNINVLFAASLQDNYTFNQISKHLLKIEKKQLSNAWDAPNSTVTFNKLRQDLRLTIDGFIESDVNSICESDFITSSESGSIIEIKKSSNSISLVFGAKDVGTYKYLVNSFKNGNYVFTPSLERTLVINPVQLNVDIIGNDESYEYDGLSHGIVFKINGLDKSDIEAISSRVYARGADNMISKTGTNYIEYNCSTTRVGNHSVELYSDPDLRNYTIISQASFSITPRVLSAEWQKKDAYYYDGSDKEVVLVLSRFIDLANSPIIRFTTTNAQIDRDVANNIVRFTFKASALGEHTFSVSQMDTNYYSFSEIISTTIEIKSKLNLSINWSSNAGNEISYDGLTHELVATITGIESESDVNLVCEAMYYSGQPNIVKASNTITLAYSYINVGENSASISIAGIDKYEDISSSESLSIIRKSLEVDINGGIEEANYKGNQLVTIKITGLTQSDSDELNVSSLSQYINKSENVSTIDIEKDRDVIVITYTVRHVGKYSVSLDADVLDCYHVEFDSTFSVTKAMLTFNPTKETLVAPFESLILGIAEGENFSDILYIHIYTDEECKNEINFDTDLLIPGTYYYVLEFKNCDLTSNYELSNQTGNYVIEE